MSILLDGENLPGYDYRVKAQGKIEHKDLSGEGSNTAGAHGGWKPWMLQVRLKINFDQAGSLRALRDLVNQADLDTGLPHLVPEAGDYLKVRQPYFYAERTCQQATASPSDALGH